ncbi:hypothetical protein DOTSEDRAFT_37007 [Dothistroma septosporum NZE10]|uniref:Uncharacterized protein n=1 Tax=Dothistroma septosporum (strain NZE10 / CBS 128990) TaxID=675120 RepID=N1PK33_DOTSN|nr:hypothetical protein DOTSEDRAFT_37007 [Dothistroma septosporum NZE10]
MGCELSLEICKQPLSYLDPEAGMIEIADDSSWRYNTEGVAVNCTIEVGPGWEAPIKIIRDCRVTSALDSVRVSDDADEDICGQNIRCSSLSRHSIRQSARCATPTNKLATEDPIVAVDIPAYIMSRLAIAGKPLKYSPFAEDAVRRSIA